MMHRAWIPPVGTVLLVSIAGFLVWQAITRTPSATVGRVTLDPLPQEETLGGDRTEKRGRPMRIDLEQDLLKRTVFSANRAPYEAPPPEPEPEVLAVKPEPEPEPEPQIVAPPPPPDPPLLELRGTMEDDGIWHALLSKPGQSGVWLGKGDIIDDWQVAVVEGGFVLLRHGDAEHRVELMK